MAGPKARGATLMQHANTAAGLVSSIASSAFNRGASQQNLKAGFAKDEDESDSDSDTSTSSDDEEREEENHDAILRQLSASSSAPKAKINGTNGAKNAAPAPAKTTKLDNAKEGSAKSKSVKKSQQKEESSESESEESADSADEKKSKQTTQKKTKAPVKPDSDSSAEDSDASSEEDRAAPVKAKNAKASVEQKKAPAKKVAPQALRGDESESDTASGSDSDESETEVPASKAKKAPAPTPSKVKEPVKTTKNGSKPSQPVKSSAVSKSQERVEDSSDSEDENGSGSSDDDSGDRMDVDKRSEQAQSHEVQEILANNFHLQKANENFNSADVVQFFKKAKKEGKQIWYFTAPASVPIEVVQKHAIELDKVQQGQPILSYNGNDYEADFDNPATTPAIKVIIPDKSGVKYTDRKAVDRTLHIKQVTRFTRDGPTTSTRAATTVSALPRPQPKGLRPSYTPIGVPPAIMNGTVVAEKVSNDDEDVDMADSPPPASTQPSAKKRKQPVEEDATPKQNAKASTSKKTKKAKTDDDSTPSGKKKGNALLSSSQVQARTVTPIAPPSIPNMARTSSPALPPTASGTSQASSVKTPTVNSLKAASKSKKETPIAPPTFGASKRS